MSQIVKKIFGGKKSKITAQNDVLLYWSAEVVTRRHISCSIGPILQTKYIYVL